MEHIITQAVAMLLMAYAVGVTVAIVLSIVKPLVRRRPKMTDDTDFPPEDPGTDVSRPPSRQHHNENLTPQTRRLIIMSLVVVAISCIIAEVVLAVADSSGSDALMAVASAAVGGIAGLAVPGNVD